MSYFSEARKYFCTEHYEEAYKLFEQGAAAGEIKCYYGIALFIYKGYAVEKDPKKAKKIFAKYFKPILSLAKAGDAEAMFIIACYYGNKFYVRRNLTRSMKWLIKAAENNNAEAQYWLGNQYIEGGRLPKNVEKAIELYRAAAEQGNIEAIYELGSRHLIGDEIVQDYSIAVPLLQIAAEQDFCISQYILGLLYEHGNDANIEQNFEEAARWYEKASRCESDAQWRLGIMYELGAGVEKNLDKAFELYKLSAADNNEDGLWTLGRMYELGLGVEKDYSEAMRLYGESLKMGNSFAQMNIGRLYEEGKILKQDYATAVHWYKLSADQGNSDGMWRLASMYFEGLGVEKNTEYAIELLEKAHSLRNCIASKILGELYYNGDVVPQDYKKAVEYWSSIQDFIAEPVHHFQLAQCYHNCRGVEYDPADDSTRKERLEKAKKYYEMAMSHGYRCNVAYNMLRRDLGEIERSGATRAYAEAILATEISGKALLDKIENDLKNDFGEAWDLLKENTKRFLISGIFYYVVTVSQGSDVYNNLDFTNVVATLSKALETELMEFFGKGYVDFLKNIKKIPASDFDPDKYRFVIYDKRIREKENIIYFDKDNYGFTLGSLPFVIEGDYKMNAPIFDPNAINENDASLFDTNAMNKKSGPIHRNLLKNRSGQIYERRIDPLMTEYARRLFKEDAFENMNFDVGAVNYLIDLSDSVKQITKIRNPASHGKIVTCFHAEVISDSVIKMEKLLKEFVTKVKPEYINMSLENSGDPQNNYVM